MAVWLRQVVSEDPSIDPSPVFDATNWAHFEVDRQSANPEGYGDKGTVFYTIVPLPANFGTPGDSPSLCITAVYCFKLCTPPRALSHR